MIQALADLERVMKDMIDIEAEMKFNSQVLDDVYQKLVQGDEIASYFEPCISTVAYKVARWMLRIGIPTVLQTV